MHFFPDWIVRRWRYFRSSDFLGSGVKNDNIWIVRLEPTTTLEPLCTINFYFENSNGLSLRNFYHNSFVFFCKFFKFLLNFFRDSTFGNCKRTFERFVQSESFFIDLTTNILAASRSSFSTSLLLIFALNQADDFLYVIAHLSL